MHSQDSPTNLSALESPLKIQTIDHIRRRPSMYLGALDHRGAIHLLNEVFALFLETVHAQPCTIALRVIAKDTFQIEAQANIDWVAQIQQLDPFVFLSSPLSMLVLRAASETLHVHYNGRAYSFSPFAETQPWQPIPDNGRGWIQLEFQLDPQILNTSQLAADTLANRMRLLAMLYPHANMHFQDVQVASAQEVHYHFPQGLQQLYGDTKAELGVATSCDLHFQGRWAGNAYQIALGLTTSPLSSPSIQSFANTLETKWHGSLVDGVLEGIQRAIQSKTQDAQIPWRQNRSFSSSPSMAGLPIPKIKRADIRAHLILVAAIEGDNLEFHHPTRDKLHSKAALHAAREIVYHLVLEEFERSPAFFPTLVAQLGRS